MRRAHHPFLDHAIRHDSAVQIRPDQPDHAGVCDPFLKPVDEDVVVDPIEEFLQIDIHDDPPTRLHVGLRREDGLLRASARTEAVAVFAEGWIKDRLQHLQ